MRWVLVLLSCAWSVLATAQTPSPTPPLPPPVEVGNPSQDEVEQLIDGGLEDEDVPAEELERIAETRTYYARRPIDLNAATVEQLLALNLLSPSQAAAVVARRGEAGDYLDPLELQAVPQLSLDEVRALLPYVTVAASAQTALGSLAARWRDAVGYAATRTAYQSTSANTDNWLGPRLPLYVRVRQTAGRLFSWGLVAENDAGERYGGPGRPLGFDYVSAHAFADELPGVVETVALGDYGLNWGQGLVSFTGFGTGKGALVMNVQRNARWLIPHASVRETTFYRGAATSLRLGPVRAMVMASRASLDGTVDTLDALADDLAFGTLRLSGLHRTPSEEAGRGLNRATSLGAAVEYARPWGRVSLHALTHRFAVPFGERPTVYQAFEPRGDGLTNASLAWQTYLGAVSWFGEAAVDAGGATAAITGIQVGLDRRTDVALVARRYEAEYRALYANSFGATRQPENEVGLYLALRNQLAPNWSLQVFGDVYRHPFARFRVTAPSDLYDAFGRLTYERRRRYSVYLQVRHRSAERDLSATESGVIRELRPYERSSARLQGSLTFSKALTLRGRVELARTLEGGVTSLGTLVYQDVLFDPQGTPFSMTARIALIDTDDYESRIYAYENDLLFRFRIPAYYGRGYRTYANFRYRVTRALTAELRGAYGRRRGAEDQYELAAQLRYRLR